MTEAKPYTFLKKLAATLAVAAGVVAAGTVSLIAGAPKLTPQLRAEYARLWAGMKIRPDKSNYVTARVDRISHFEDQYRIVGKATGVPWWVIGLIDELEGGGGCATHLHNGDSLKRRTVNVPAGRPKEGSPPFTWYASALDALRYDGFTEWTDWSLAGTLYKLEAYNGFGYRASGRGDGRPIPTPYLWSFATPPYSRGKYTRDGYFNRNAVSDQVGAAVLLRRMVELKYVTLPPDPSP